MLLYPQAAEKTFLLREFDDTLDPFEKDISDPIGGSYDVYLNCRDQIEQGIVSLLRFVEGDGAGGPISGKTAAVAIGADHGGFDLKETLKQYLEQRGVSVADFGANSRQPSDDYPDFAQLVGQSVANHKTQLGVLICTSGIGMSIAANKVSGVRAALVVDEQSALLARQHNDANVICLGASHTPPEVAKKIVEAFLNAHFEGGRHERRVSKMETQFQKARKIETQNC